MSTFPNVDLNLPPQSSAAPAWKQELNERLAANRARRAHRTGEQAALPGLEHLHDKPRSRDSRAAQLAARVAERYAAAPSYSEMLAAEAHASARAAEAAHAAAHAAALKAQVVAQAVLEELEPDAASMPFEPSFVPEPVPQAPVFASPAGAMMSDPLQEALVEPALPLAANLIEFPRELVAARKARPHLEEGPLHESAEAAAHDQSQLRIFEVEQESIAKAPSPGPAQPSTEWSSIRLDARPAEEDAAQPSSLIDLPLRAAPLEDRIMAGVVDIALTAAGFLLFALVFAACTAHPPTGKTVWIGGAAVLGGLFFLYQYLFFRYAGATPGMRYARIALCTFEDRNPTREEMRRRIPLLLLSACPVGLGFAWAWFDADRLGWHDRVSRMYQRSYR